MSKEPLKAKNYKLPQGLGAGIKRTRGQPILHNERKVNVNITLTPEARERIRLASQAKGVSMSEFIEQWARTVLSQEGI